MIKTFEKNSVIYNIFPFQPSTKGLRWSLELQTIVEISDSLREQRREFYSKPIRRIEATFYKEEQNFQASIAEFIRQSQQNYIAFGVYNELLYLKEQITIISYPLYVFHNSHQHFYYFRNRATHLLFTSPEQGLYEIQEIFNYENDFRVRLTDFLIEDYDYSKTFVYPVILGRLDGRINSENIAVDISSHKLKFIEKVDS